MVVIVGLREWLALKMIGDATEEVIVYFVKTCAWCLVGLSVCGLIAIINLWVNKQIESRSPALHKLPMWSYKLVNDSQIELDASGNYPKYSTSKAVKKIIKIITTSLLLGVGVMLLGIIVAMPFGEDTVMEIVGMIIFIAGLITSPISVLIRIVVMLDARKNDFKQLGRLLTRDEFKEFEREYGENEVVVDWNEDEWDEYYEGRYVKYCDKYEKKIDEENKKIKKWNKKLLRRLW